VSWDPLAAQNASECWARPWSVASDHLGSRGCVRINDACCKAGWLNGG